MDAAEFAALYRQLFPAATDDTIARAFATLDVEGAGRVDIIAWSWRLRLQDLPAIVERIQRDGERRSGGRQRMRWRWRALLEAARR